MAKKKPAAEILENPVTPPYYLQKAHVKGDAPIRDVEVEFKPGLNIIIGPNGAGKTRFLQALIAAIRLQPKNASLPGSSFLLSGSVPVTITYAAPPMPSVGEMLPFGIAVPPAIQVKAKRQSATVPMVYEAWNRLDALRYSSDPAGYNIELLEHGLPKPETLSFFAEAPDLRFRIRRLPNTELPRHLFNLLARVQRDLRLQLSHTAASSIVVEQAVEKEAGHYANYLNDYLQRCTPIKAVRLSTQLKVYFNETTDEFIINDLKLEYEVNDSWLRFKDLSDGTQRLIYLVSQLIAPNFYQAEGVFPAGERSYILLVEEPELGIHPHQLHLLLNLIREVSTKHQVILTTHSPQVLDMLKAGELDRILICTLDEPKKGTQFRRLTEAQQEKARRYMTKVGFLSDYWRYSYLEEDAEAPTSQADA